MHFGEYDLLAESEFSSEKLKNGLPKSSGCQIIEIKQLLMGLW